MHLGAIDADVEEHPARGDVAQIVGVPQRPLLIGHRPTGVAGGPVPDPQELTALCQVAVSSGKQQPGVSAALE